MRQVIRKLQEVHENPLMCCTMTSELIVSKQDKILSLFEVFDIARGDVPPIKHMVIPLTNTVSLYYTYSHKPSILNLHTLYILYLGLKIMIAREVRKSYGNYIKLGYRHHALIEVWKLELLRGLYLIKICLSVFSIGTPHVILWMKVLPFYTIK